MLSVLKNINFRLFFLAEIISAFGVGISTVGANWYIVDKTGDSSLLGIMLSLNVLAGFLASPLIGGLADKYNRRDIIMYTYLTQIVLYLLITVLLIYSGFHSYLIISFAIVNGIGWTTYMATSRSLVKQILERDAYTDANSLLEVSLQSGMFLAGGVSGFIYKFYGFSFIIGMTIMMYVLSVILLKYIKVSKPIGSHQQNNFYKEYIEGWKFLKNHKLMFIFGLVSVIPTIFTMIFNVTLPAFVSSILKSDSTVFGTADMFYGIGGLFAGICSAWLASVIKPKNIIYILFLVLALDVLLISNVQTIYILFLGSFLLGYCISSIRIYMNSALMYNISDKYIGRTFSTITSISLLLQCLLLPSLGKIINNTMANIGFTLIFIVSVLLILILILINKNGEVLYSSKKEIK